MRFNIKALALSCGVLYGAALFLLTLWLMVRGL